jgi:hypothetical protein
MTEPVPSPGIPSLVWKGVVVLLLLTGCDSSNSATTPMKPDAAGCFHVHPGESIQAAVDAAAASSIKQVIVHAGEYRPQRPAQALVWFNARHDGVRLEGLGDVVLHAANAAIADPKTPGAPAIVNHILYFGDGITSRTHVSGLRLTGANGFATRSEDPEIQPDNGSERLRKAQFFYEDGGAIKIFGRSYPVLRDLDIVNNYASPCGGGVSIEHRGFNESSVCFENCLFRNNRCRITGSAVDVLPGSAARFMNCLFTGNIANTGDDDVSEEGFEYNAEHGCGALTVFGDSRVDVQRCTFTANWNGVDDKGRGNTYRDCLFWQNTAEGGVSPGARYEFDILSAAGVEGCRITGGIADLRNAIDAARNSFDGPDPEFDDQFVPRHATYKDVGYRPTGRWNLSGPADKLPQEDAVDGGRLP